PVSLRPWRKAAMKFARSAGDPPCKKPTTGVAGCCARAASDQAMADPAIPLMRSRRRIAFLQGPGLRRLSLTRTRLQQGFATDEMWFRGQFAQQQSQAAHVRFGSKADIRRRLNNVRFTPKSGHACIGSRIVSLVGSGEISPRVLGVKS